MATLTQDDIKLLTDVFATREEVASKKDVAEIKESVNILTNAVDAFAKEALKNSQEITMWSNKVTRLEAHMKIIAEKVGVRLEY